MNDLQRLFKVRGITLQELGEALGFNWHAVQKNVKGTRKNQHIQTAIAHYLGLTREQTFGPSAPKHLRPLIEAEIDKKQQFFGAKLKTKYLPNSKNRIADHREAGNG